MAGKPAASHKGPLSASLLAHFALVVAFVYLPRALPADVSAAESPASRVRIYYRIPIQETAKVLPRIAPAGEGGRPGQDAATDRLPKPISESSQNILTAVSRPSLPDNQRQTIFQRSSPPDLRILTDVKVPNVLLGSPAASPRAPLNFDPKDAYPVVHARQTAPLEAPVVSNALASPSIALGNAAMQPRLAMPIGENSGPLPRSSESATASDSQGQDPNLLAIGVDPAQTSMQLNIPTGNRSGDFSIAPPNGKDGAPGGDNIGEAGGGVKQGAAGAGDTSTGIGPGRAGGGGGSTAPVGTLSIDEAGHGGESYASLGPAMIPSMVFAIPTPVLPRRNSLVVSAGPIGGGGLDAYGALHCGKIYSVFLPMPGKSWTLQYCDPSAFTTTSQRSRTAVIHLQAALLPPDPETRFDFRRLPFPKDKLGKVIVLKGVLRQDGVVADLQLYQGILPEMDKAALVAFRRWKFKPAMRNGKPIPVQILVGIPPAVTGAH